MISLFSSPKFGPSLILEMSEISNSTNPIHAQHSKKFANLRRYIQSMTDFKLNSNNSANKNKGSQRANSNSAPQ